MNRRAILNILQYVHRDFARKFTTLNLPSHAEGAQPQNCTAEQPRNQVPETDFDKFPDPFSFQCWKTSLKTEVCSCSSIPRDAMFWIWGFLQQLLSTARWGAMLREGRLLGRGQRRQIWYFGGAEDADQSVPRVAWRGDEGCRKWKSSGYDGSWPECSRRCFGWAGFERVLQVCCCGYWSQRAFDREWSSGHSRKWTRQVSHGNVVWNSTCTKCTDSSLFRKCQEVLLIHIANLCIWTQEDLLPKVMPQKGILETLTYLHRDLQGRFWLGIFPLIQKELILKIVRLSCPRNQFSECHFYQFPETSVKSIPPNTEKWLRKRYDENDDNNMSNETKRETNYSMNNKWKQQHAQHAHHLSMNAQRALLYTCSSCLTPHWLKIWVLSFHLHSHPWAHLFESLLLFYFHLSFPVFFSFHLLHCELYSELDNLIAMQILRTSANKGSNDAYDVHTSLTGYELNCMDFSELGDSQGSFSYMTPSSDLDIDDATLGKVLTEAHRGQADYCDPEGVSVSQSVSRLCLLCSIEQGNLWEKEMSISQLVLVSRETRTVLTASFLKSPKVRKWSIDQGNLRSEIAQMHRFGLYLKIRDKWLSQNIARKLVITNSKHLMQKKSAEFYEKNYGDSNWNFVKFINKVLQRWRNYENSKVLPSIRSQDESSSRTRTLFWNYQAEYKNYKMK